MKSEQRTSVYLFGNNKIYSAEGIFSELHKIEYPYAHCHTYYEIVIVFNGSIRHNFTLLEKNLETENQTRKKLQTDVLLLDNVEFETEELKSGDVQIVPPNLCHYYEFLDPNSEYVNITIGKKTFLSLLSFLHCERLDVNDLPKLVNVSPDDTQSLKSFFLEITENTALSERDISALNKILTLNALKFFFYDRNDKKDLPSWIKDLIATIRNPEYYNCSISKIISNIPYSQAYIYREIKKYFNVSLKVLLTEQKMKHACYLLKNTDLSVITISNSIGFSNAGFFAKVFRSYYSVTPLEYRKRSKSSAV